MPSHTALARIDLQSLPNATSHRRTRRLNARCSTPAPTSTFAFSIGHRVQPAHSSPAITWRGQHKERHPATGLVHRINVYYLDNSYWDCYCEDGLKTVIGYMEAKGTCLTP